MSVVATTRVQAPPRVLAGVTRRFVRNRRAAVGLTLILLFYAAALLAPAIAPYRPETQQLAQRLQPPSRQHLMGTDGFGRDVLSRALHAGRVSQPIGLLSMGLSVILGALIGALAGYYGGKTDEILMRGTELVLTFPTFFLLIAVVAVYGSSIPLLIVIMGATAWPITARLVRAEFLSVREQVYVEAIRAMGGSHLRIMFRHILPNVAPVIIVSATLRVAIVILIEAGLSFLGVGVQPPTPSWGNMVADGRQYLHDAWWISTFPGLFVFFSVISYNLVGDGLRDALDPKTAMLLRTAGVPEEKGGS